MGSDALRATIEAEGRARVAAILRAAEDEASRLREEAASRATRRRSHELDAVEAELRREANASLSAARAEARKDVLEARAAFIKRVLDEARAVIASQSDAPEFARESLARAERALDHMPADAPIVFTCASGVAPVLETAFADRSGIRVDRDAALTAGFRAAGANGTIVIDATPDSLLDTDREALAIEIVRRFESADEGGA